MCERGRQSWRGWHLTWLLLAGALASPLEVNAAERVVLGEEFTATW